VERLGLMSSETDGETAAELRGGSWQQSCGGGGKAEGCKQHRGDSAGGLRGKNEPKGFVGWSSEEGPNAAERNAEGDLRGGDEREEGDGGKQVGGERSEWRHEDGALKFKFQRAMHSLRFKSPAAARPLFSTCKVHIHNESALHEETRGGESCTRGTTQGETLHFVLNIESTGREYGATED
jgi:hypothetical protein